MSTFETTIQLASLSGQGEVEIGALVDTGAFYSILPSSVLDGIGVQRVGESRFVFADGRTEEMDIGFAFVALNGGRSVPTIVAFGVEEAQPLLGAYALEGLELMVDPRGEQLVPRGLLHA
ncbi:MAG: hypothetical protein OXC55_07030 [Chloroflexi bacterium]|nr:hypothetical protein [Chloroflexota bacterium]